MGTITGIGGKVVGAVGDGVAELDKKYEEGKKALGEMVGLMKIPTLGDRSHEGGTPKINVSNLCKTSPQCISSGKSELIREVNIRLAGFGGARPTDEFTSLTEKCIKQFQRDYMGTEQTGKICGSFIAALDKFNLEYPIDQYMGAIACPCSKYGGGAKCKGFGAGRTKQYKILGVEAPGMHRTTMWILKAAHFYLKKEKELGVKITGVSSGYRCIENNAGHNGSHKVRTTVNHMGGAAIDILISDNKKLDAVRKNIFIKYMNASPIGVRGENQVFLESAAQSATGWVHFDILWYEDLNVKNVKQYATTTEKIINGSLCDLFKKDNDRILGCSGIVKNSTTQSTPKSTNLDKNITAFLDTIAKSEGTFDHGDNGYNVMVTGKLMKGYADHPFTHSDKALHVKGSLYSTASGRYQIMRVNWYGSKENPKLGLKYQLGLNDFSPKNQDVAAISLLKRRNAYNLISQGKIKTAFRTTSLNKEWASFPGAGYNQQEHKIEKILKWYQDFGGIVTD